MYIFQKTLLQKVAFKGIGLHGGLESEVNILPANENYGIVFKRTDLNKDNIIKEFLSRGGLRCRILKSSKVEIGDSIKIIN